MILWKGARMGTLRCGSIATDGIGLLELLKLNSATFNSISTSAWLNVTSVSVPNVARPLSAASETTAAIENPEDCLVCKEGYLME